MNAMNLLTPAEHKQQEDLITQIYSKELQNGDAFLDVGANIGHHTWRMAECVGSSGQGFAIEPVPAFLDKLRRVLTIKKVDWVEVFSLAASDSCSKTSFYYRPDYPGWSSLLEKHHHPDDPLKNRVELDVELSTIDKLLLHRLEGLKFIKLDIEGSELPALRGGQGVIRAHQPLIVLENIVSFAADLNGYDAVEFFDFFTDIEYILYDLMGNLIPANLVKTGLSVDLPVYYLALPKTHPAAQDPKDYFGLE